MYIGVGIGILNKAMCSAINRPLGICTEPVCQFHHSHRLLYRRDRT